MGWIGSTRRMDKNQRVLSHSDARGLLPALIPGRICFDPDGLRQEVHHLHMRAESEGLNRMKPSQVQGATRFYKCYQVLWSYPIHAGLLAFDRHDHVTRYSLEPWAIRAVPSNIDKDFNAPGDPCVPDIFIGCFFILVNLPRLLFKVRLYREPDQGRQNGRSQLEPEVFKEPVAHVKRYQGAAGGTGSCGRAAATEGAVAGGDAEGVVFRGFKAPASRDHQVVGV